MNKKLKFVLISICILLAIFIIFSLFYLNTIDKVLLDNNKQVDVLCQIYECFLKEYNDNIILDESAFRNFKTNEKFSDENIQKLKQYEKTTPDSEKNYTLLVGGNPYVNTITLTLKDNTTNKTYQQKFYLKPNLFKINFKASEIINMLN